MFTHRRTGLIGALLALALGNTDAAPPPRISVKRPDTTPPPRVRVWGRGSARWLMPHCGKADCARRRAQIARFQLTEANGLVRREH